MPFSKRPPSLPSSQTSAIKTTMLIALLGPMFMSTTLALLGIIAIMVLIVPRFEAIIKDFNTKLSPMQSMFYAAADFVRGGNGQFPMWMIIAPAIVGLMLALGVLMFKPLTRPLARVLLMVIFAITVMLIGVTVISCFSPLATLMENLATDPAHAV